VQTAHDPEVAQDAKAPPRLVQTIAIPNAKGRLDHLDIDVKGQRLFVSALENGTVEVVSLRSGKWFASIVGFRKPQGIAYVASLNKLFVASGDDGIVRVFRGDNFELLDSIKLELGPNRVAHDAGAEILYVGYGGEHDESRAASLISPFRISGQRVNVIVDYVGVGVFLPAA
jgi:DNA-binding beta-propeller fold protein YncE